MQTVVDENAQLVCYSFR